MGCEKVVEAKCSQAVVLNRNTSPNPRSPFLSHNFSHGFDECCFQSAWALICTCALHTWGFLAFALQSESHFCHMNAFFPFSTVFRIVFLDGLRSHIPPAPAHAATYYALMLTTQPN